MIKKNLDTIIFSLFICVIVFSLISCKQSATESEIGQPVRAPERSLSASAIMKLQGISSIHYVEYDSVIVNGDIIYPFAPSFEYFIDTCRIKMMQYYFDDPLWNVTVYDINKNIAWNKYSGILTYLQLPNWPAAFEQEIQANLGSNLKGDVKYIGRKYLGDKLCDVFEDSTNYQEWVWIKYRLPIQYIRISTNRNITQTAYVQKRNIEINKKFPDDTFDPQQ
jgi:hypothetical protein